MDNDILLTLDIDWAPDFVIEHVADTLIEKGIFATWYVTHQTPVLEKLRKHRDLFELGIHPNFLPHSTQGSDIEDTVHRLMHIVPEARTVRTHSLVQSTHILGELMGLTPVETDSTMFLPYVPHVQPFSYQWRGMELVRIPFVWEDDFEMERFNPDWSLDSIRAIGPGLKVLNFHPIHIYLNSKSIHPWHTLRERVHPLNEAEPEDLQNFRNPAMGTASVFEEVTRYLAKAEEMHTISSLKEQWEADRGTAGS